jgi:hypothetical protein
MGIWLARQHQPCCDRLCPYRLDQHGGRASLTIDHGKAIRYGIGVGREGFTQRR